MRALASALVLLLPAAAAAPPPRFAAPPIAVSTAEGTPAELQTQARLQALLRRYDVRRWVFHPRVVVDEGVLPHSHPVVTVKTGETDLQLLSTVLHENIHWLVARHPEREAAAVRELKALYPDLPVEPPEGARGERSSYLHVIVCTLELAAMREVAGDADADAAIRYWSGHHYKGIYRTVLRDEAKLMALIRRHGLDNPRPKAGRAA